jgi:hypothetical protein
MNSKRKTALLPSFSTFNPQPISLPLIFALVHFLEHGEPGVFCARGFISLQRVERGKDFAHRLLARRTIRERLGRKRTVQGEFPAADLAVAFAQFVFVKRHKMNFDFQLPNVELKLITFDGDECD